MKVFILQHSYSYDDGTDKSKTELLGIYSSKEKAFDQCEKMWNKLRAEPEGMKYDEEHTEWTDWGVTGSEAFNIDTIQVIPQTVDEDRRDNFKYM